MGDGSSRGESFAKRENKARAFGENPLCEGIAKGAGLSVSRPGGLFERIPAAPHLLPGLIYGGSVDIMVRTSKAIPAPGGEDREEERQYV